MKIVFATNNQNKIAEIKDMLPKEIELLSLQEINCNEQLPETQNTLQGNAMQKAEFVFQNYGFNCFADDTGLEIKALNNEPVVYSARYAGWRDLSTHYESSSQSEGDCLQWVFNRWPSSGDPGCWSSKFCSKTVYRGNHIRETK